MSAPTRKTEEDDDTEASYLIEQTILPIKASWTTLSETSSAAQHHHCLQEEFFIDASF